MTQPSFDLGRLSPIEAAKAFVAADQSSRVTRLVDLGDALGFARTKATGGMAAGIVRKYGHGNAVVRAMGAALVADGDPWEFVMGVLRNGNGTTGTAKGRNVPVRTGESSAADNIDALRTGEKRW